MAKSILKGFNAVAKQTRGRGFRKESGEFLKIRHPNSSSSYVKFSVDFAKMAKLTYDQSCHFLYNSKTKQLAVLVSEGGELDYSITYNTKNKAQKGRGHKVIQSSLSELPQARFKLDPELTQESFEYETEDGETVECTLYVFDFEKELQTITRRRKKKVKEESSEVSESSEEVDEDEELEDEDEDEDDEEDWEEDDEDEEDED